MLRAALSSLALVIALGSFAAPRAHAQARPAQATPEYLAHVGRGLSAMAAGDRGAALTAFRQALQLDGSRPDAHCLLAEVERSDGDHAAALTAYDACLRGARATSEQRWTARALHGIATTLERMGNLTEARTAWQEYVRFADGAAAIASPAVGRARMASIDAITELDRVSTEVRQRADARRAEANTPSP